jgi:hypothetical protein
VTRNPGVRSAAEESRSMKAPLLSGCPSSNSELGRIRVHVLYKRAEIPAKTVIPAIALSVTYRKQASPANTGSTPVSATNPFRIICLQNRRTDLSAVRCFQDVGRARFHIELHAKMQR